MDSRKYLDLIAEHRLSVNRPQETVALTGKILEVRDQVASRKSTLIILVQIAKS